MWKVNDIRNIAVIAHVDHGKTTLVDALLKQSKLFRDNQAEMGQSRILDTNDLEREKGITIMSKNASILYKGIKINIIDTPGHADFGGEVERVLNMADSALLIVDAGEGVMPQTRFVLKKAIEFGLKIIVVINKIDKKEADSKVVLNQIEDLFLSMAVDEDFLDFPVVYAIGRQGKTFENIPNDLEVEADVTPLLEAIYKYSPSSTKDKDQPLRILVSSFEKNEYLGKLALGRVNSGKIRVGQRVKLISENEGKLDSFNIEKLYINEGISKIEVNDAESGEIVYLSGNSEIKIGQTIADLNVEKAMKTISVTEPTIKASFGPNTSILAPNESTFLTSRQIKDRLKNEVERDLGLRIEDDHQDSTKLIVAGRGELHLAILIEKLRREGYALEIGKPEVVLKRIGGVICEPVEELTILTSQDYVGVISSELGKRRGEMLDMSTSADGSVRMIYKISEENSLGLRSILISQTRGSMSLSYSFLGFEPKQESHSGQRNGVMIASKSGKSLSYGLDLTQKRGIMFVSPGEDIYEGQVVGLRPIERDLEVNVCRGKQLTNMRAAGNDDTISLTPATKYSIEECLDFIEEDELIDVTPKAVRLRKKYLSRLDRLRQSRKKKK
ncbi:translational GTPase TypA [Candidatus Shapirobacteria bacterium]|nr:MAG: translational GTPase TypA [Candidatus Shapirobacteria bacterium]